MKGQFTWDYIVSIVAFVVVVSYMSLQIINSAPNYTSVGREEFLRSEAYQISEILLNDPGEPKAWTLADVERIGLSNESFNKTNYLSSRKLADFDSMCTAANYGNASRLLGVDISRYNFSVVVIDKSDGGVKVSDCRPPLLLTRLANVTIKRYAYTDDGSYAEFIVQAW